MVFIFFASCNSNDKERKLADKFFDMRKIPSDILTYKRIGNFEVAYQSKSKITEEYNYPDYYSFGKLNKNESDFKYITHVEGISPIENFDYIKKSIEFFESDSTYVDVIIKENNYLKMNVYRKVKNSVKIDFMMWKWVRTPMNKFEFETVEIMNNHLF